MTDEQIREFRGVLADRLPHENREFLRQIRDGEQDDGPFMQGGLIMAAWIKENFVLAQPSAPVGDE